MSGLEITPWVGIVMGSDSDFPVMEDAMRVLETFAIPYEVRILSAHRSPEETAQYARTCALRGLKVLIAGAGWAAHLAGVLAAATTLPVIGVPIASSPLQGMDALLATVQMPPGVPVATMAIGQGGARNAALFAVQVLAVSHAHLAERLLAYKDVLAAEVAAKNEKMQQRLSLRAVTGGD
jgi:phosphoribosylaminoimidazole carboxylase PurE protein